MTDAPYPRLMPVAPRRGTTCRVPGCNHAASDELGFCAGCRTAYDARHAHLAARARAAVDLVRAAHPSLFAELDALRPDLGDLLAAHLAAYTATGTGLRTLSLQGLDDFLAGLSDQGVRP